MKTTKEINEMSTLLDEELKQPNIKSRQIKKIKLQKERLKLCLLYLETNPSEAFINRMLTEESERKKNILDGFELWKKNLLGGGHRKSQRIFYLHIKIFQA